MSRTLNLFTTNTKPARLRAELVEFGDDGKRRVVRDFYILATDPVIKWAVDWSISGIIPREADLVRS
jgi:hypothetical protein